MIAKLPLETLFPDDLARIAGLRCENRVFDELCSDFEGLYGRIPEDARRYADAIDSLRALEREIRDWLTEQAHHDQPGQALKRPVSGQKSGQKSVQHPEQPKN